MENSYHLCGCYAVYCNNRLCIITHFITWFMPTYRRNKAAQILIIGLYPLTLVNVAAVYFNSTDDQKVYMSIQIVSIILSLPFSILFLYLNKSITSVAIATSITFSRDPILMNTVFLLKIRKK